MKAGNSGVLPVALAVAGSDSGGGAGIQADLAAFRYFGVWGATAVTAITAQLPQEIRAAAPVPPGLVAAQMQAVFEAFQVRAVKTGMLVNADCVRAVVRALGSAPPGIPVVVDPVVTAGSGRRLLDDDGFRALCMELLPRATAITPNLPEASLLLGRELRSPQDVAKAAAELAQRYRAWVLLKGGHAGWARGTDWLAGDGRLWSLRARAVSFPESAGHGTGCSLSAAWAACLALGESPERGAHKAKAYVLGGLLGARDAGRGGAVRWGPAELPLDEVAATRVG